MLLVLSYEGSLYKISNVNDCIGHRDVGPLPSLLLIVLIFSFPHHAISLPQLSIYSLDLCHRGVEKMAVPAPIINPCMGIFDLNFL